MSGASGSRARYACVSVCVLHGVTKHSRTVGVGIQGRQLANYTAISRTSVGAGRELRVGTRRSRVRRADRGREKAGSEGACPVTCLGIKMYGYVVLELAIEFMPKIKRTPFVRLWRSCARKLPVSLFFFFP